jgi:hypothetical protein
MKALSSAKTRVAFIDLISLSEEFFIADFAHNAYLSTHAIVRAFASAVFLSGILRGYFEFVFALGTFSCPKILSAIGN